MSRQASPALIGAFVAGAVGLIVAGILIISGGRLLLTDKTSYVLYFQGSVKGLNIGSPVSFRGVNIGTVTNKERPFATGRCPEIACFESQCRKQRIIAGH